MIPEIETSTEEKIKAAVEAERNRCVKICIDQYRQWRSADAEGEQYGMLCVGAMAATSNILARMVGLIKEEES